MKEATHSREGANEKDHRAQMCTIYGIKKANLINRQQLELRRKEAYVWLLFDPKDDLGRLNWKQTKQPSYVGHCVFAHSRCNGSRKSAPKEKDELLRVGVEGKALLNSCY